MLPPAGDAMPVYHFNVHDGVRIDDLDGHSLENLAAAKREAINLSGHAIRELGEIFWHGEEWQMEVTDADGLVLFTLTFFANVAPTLHR